MREATRSRQMLRTRHTTFIRSTVEHVGPVPDQSWATAVVVKLNENMGDLGDVLVRIHYRGAASNRVRVGVGHVGGGPPDDPGAVPTPGPIAEEIGINPITAGTLTTDEVRTIIAQAVSAAVALNRLVTVAVTDREGNVLGVFNMTGAPTMMQIRGGGPLQTPDPVTGLVPVGLEGTRLLSRFGAVSKAGSASLLSTAGNAFNTRTAGFIIQDHIPSGYEVSGPVDRSTAFSIPRCRARTLRYRVFRLASVRIPAACLFTRMVFRRAEWGLKAMVFMG